MRCVAKGGTPERVLPAWPCGPSGANRRSIPRMGLRLLKATGYGGWLSLEVAPSRDPLAEAVRGARYVAEVWAETH